MRNGEILACEILRDLELDEQARIDETVKRLLPDVLDSLRRPPTSERQARLFEWFEMLPGERPKIQNG
jgi:hypothetical protein